MLPIGSSMSYRHLQRLGRRDKTLNIVTNLNRSHYAPHVVTLSPEPDQSYHGLFRDADVPVTSLALSRAGGLVLGPSRLRSITTAIDPDVVHTQGIRADSLAAHCLFAYPQVTTLRNFPPEDYIPRYGAVLRTTHGLAAVSGQPDWPINQSPAQRRSETDIVAVT